VTVSLMAQTGQSEAIHSPEACVKTVLSLIRSAAARYPLVALSASGYYSVCEFSMLAPEKLSLDRRLVSHDVAT